MTDLNSLLVFAAVSEAGGFSAASRRLGMPVSTVSRQVAALEDQLGLRLIERSTRSLRMTEAGALVFEQARRAVEVSDAVNDLVADQATTVSGLLRLAAPPGLAEALLVPVATAYRASYPEVHLRVSKVTDGAMEQPDLTLRFGTLKSSALIAVRLLHYRKRLVASPGYLAGRPAPGSPRDLASHRLLTLPGDVAEQRWELVQADGPGRETLRFRPYVAVDEMGTLVAAALSGAGLCDLPPLIRPDLLRDGRLVEVMPGWRFEAFDLSLVQLNRRHVPRAVRLFKEMAVRLSPRLFPDLPT